MMVIGTCPAPAPWPQQTWPTALGPTGPLRWVDARRQSSQLLFLTSQCPHLGCISTNWPCHCHILGRGTRHWGETGRWVCGP